MNKKKKPQRSWIKSGDLDFLKSTYLFFSDEELGKLLGRSRKTIHNIRVRYGLLKTPALKKINTKRNKIPAIFFVPKEAKTKRGKLIDFIEHIA